MNLKEMLRIEHLALNDPDSHCLALWLMSRLKDTFGGLNMCILGIRMS